MSLELLKKLAERKLPCIIDSPSDIDKLRVLRAAGFVAAMFLHRPNASDAAKAHEEAQVLAITAAGREALDRVLQETA